MNQEDLRCVAVDGLVHRDSEVLLIKRGHEPHKGKWVLPGGMVERDETTRNACTREVLEETGIKTQAQSMIGIYDDPERDKRGNISICFNATPEVDDKPEPGDEADEAAYHMVSELPDLGFDHSTMIRDALNQGYI